MQMGTKNFAPTPVGMGPDISKFIFDVKKSGHSNDWFYLVTFFIPHMTLSDLLM